MRKRDRYANMMWLDYMHLPPECGSFDPSPLDRRPIADLLQLIGTAGYDVVVGRTMEGRLALQLYPIKGRLQQGRPNLALSYAGYDLGLMLLRGWWDMEQLRNVQVGWHGNMREIVHWVA